MEVVKKHVGRYHQKDDSEYYYTYRLVPQEIKIGKSNYYNYDLHREDGPAWGTKISSFWYLHDKRHRYDGPAVKVKNPCSKRWFIHDKEIDEHEYKSWLIEMGIDINNLTPEDKAIIDMKWS